MRVQIVDAFTDRPFAGNPAGVCLLNDGTWPGAEWMRRIAAELSHETAFARPLPDGAGADWALRWFTPAAESNLCGHAIPPSTATGSTSPATRSPSSTASWTTTPRADSKACQSPLR